MAVKYLSIPAEQEQMKDGFWFGCGDGFSLPNGSYDFSKYKISTCKNLSSGGDCHE
jgi:hypothetical protein